MSDLKQQLSSLSRDLQKKIAKAKPVVQQVESGELKTLTAEQQRLVDNYPKWIADLETVKNGELPSKKESTSAPAKETKRGKGRVVTPDPESDEEAEVAEITPPRQRGGRQSQPRESPASAGKQTPAQKRQRMIDQIKAADKKTKKTLIDSYVNGRVDRTKLAALTKEYDSICQLRRDILSGRIAKPTKMQNNRIALADQLKKEMSLEQEAMTLRAERERITFLCEIGEDDEDEEEEEEEEEAYEEEEEYDEEEEEDDQDEVASEKADEAASETPEKEDEPEETEEERLAREAAEEEAERKAAEEEAARRAEEEAARKAAKEEAARKAAEAKAAKKAAEEEAARQAAEEEAARKAAEEEERRNRVIDWSEITITKNRHRVNQGSDSEPSPTSSPTSAEPKVQVNPTEYTALVLGVSKPPAKTEAAKSDGKKAAKPAKGGKNSAATTTGSALMSTTLGQNVIRRVQRDFEICRKTPLNNVRFTIVDDNMLLWRINVCPTDGPLAGCIIPLEMKFGELYPIEPPVVRCLTDVPHTGIGTSDSIRNVLCMEHTTPLPAAEVTHTKGWSPAYSALSILTQLQNFFGDEAFVEAKQALGPSFKHRLLCAKGEISRFAAGGHTNLTPFPALPCFNGPLDAPPKSLVVKDGAFRVKGQSPVGHRWVHAYSCTGVYHCTFTVINEGESGSLIGISSGRYNGPPEKIGQHPQSIALNTFTGAIGNCGHQEEYEGKVDFPLPHHTEVLLTVDMDKQTITFTVEDSVIGEISDVANTDQWYPSFSLLSATSALSAEFVIDETADWKMAEYVKEEDPVCCFVSRTPVTDEKVVLGVGIALRRGKDFMPTHVSSDMDIISKDAAEKHKFSATGRRYDAFLPLILSKDHATRSLKELKKATSLICRNPEATTAYVPPFRPINGILTLTAAMQGAVDDFSSLPKSALPDSFSSYTRFLQCLVTLAVDSSALLDKAQAVLDESSTTIFALGPILLNIPWPQLAKKALGAEVKARSAKAGTTDSSDAGCFALLKPKLKKFLLAAAFSHSATTTSLKTAEEMFDSTLGLPSDAMLSELKQQVSTISDVTSWDALCTFLKVNVSAAEM